jgi:hypothetical protein
MTNLEKYRKDLDKLIALGMKMHVDILIQHDPHNLDENIKITSEFKSSARGCFRKNYQQFFTESIALIEQIIPSRLQEFKSLYLPDQKRKKIDISTYSIQDYILCLGSATDPSTEGKIFDDIAVVIGHFSAQREILDAANRRFDSSLFEIKQLLQADLFDSELDESKHLLKNGFVRAAGSIAGVVLERHLLCVQESHQLTIKQKNPTISVYNDALKDVSVIDVPTWRLIQRLGDLRNLCDHGKERDPSKEEVSELINGADKIIKTIH